MKRIISAVSAVLFSFFLHAQASADSLLLVKRLSAYLQYSKDLDFDKTMDYIHPSLFKIATREQLVEAMKDSYDADEIKIGFDTMYVSAVSPSFLHDNAAYRRVDYYTVMTMQFVDKTSTDDTAFVNLMMTGLKEEFPEQKVTFDKQKRNFVVKGYDLLVAIKEKDGEWMFLGVEKENPMMMDLFPAKVIDHFKLD